MWSLGCVLAELMAVSSVYKPKAHKDDRILFPGNSCFPLSPFPNPDEDNINLVSS